MRARVNETPGVASRRAAVALADGLFFKAQDFDSPEAQAALSKLTARDRAFARRLAITIARHRGTLDALVKDFMDRPPKGKARHILSIIKAGAAELLFLNAPAHAVVDSAVALAKAEGLMAMSGLANAVLRRTGREGEKWLQTVDPARLDLPDWLWDDWTTRLGEEITRAIYNAIHSRSPPLDITVKEKPDSWAKKLGGIALGESTVRLPGNTSVPSLPGFESGDWWVQDLAATIPVQILGNLTNKSVIDLCAAPGGKTAQLRAMGAEVTAVDRSPSRLNRLRENLARVRMDATEIVTADAVKWRPKDPADAVLLDAPCSATGTLRRHPEIAYRRGPDDVTKLVKLQRDLVQAAADMVKPGGLLVIATCSLQSAESSALHAFAAQQDGLEVVPATAAELPGLPNSIVQADGSVMTHPAILASEGGMDGFFIGRYRKTKS